jgi:hypothetical protein
MAKNNKTENDELEGTVPSSEGQSNVSTDTPETLQPSKQMRSVLILKRDDSNLLTVQNVEEVIETDETISELMRHAWCIEVLEDPYKGE